MEILNGSIIFLQVFPKNINAIKIISYEWNTKDIILLLIMCITISYQMLIILFVFFILILMYYESIIIRIIAASPYIVLHYE